VIVNGGLRGVDSKDSLLRANQIQGFFWEAFLGVMERLVLSDAAWERMAPLIIGRPDQKGSTGRDNRMFVEGVLWIVRTGSSWRDLPEAFGDWNSVFRRFSRWSIKGVWWQHRLPDQRRNLLHVLHAAGSHRRELPIIRKRRDFALCAVVPGRPAARHPGLAPVAN
jgi:putative transposase